MYQNWLEEMDQISWCKSSESSVITTRRIRNKGGGSWRSCTRSYYNNSRILVVFWLILSVGSSMAVMAYQNDLSAISSSSGGISSLGSSNANNRHGCVWSRTDTSTASGGASASNSNSNSYGQQTSEVMYAPGNNPFQQQQPQHNLRTFPGFLSSSGSSSSTSPYYSSSLLPSSVSASSSLSGPGELTLNCNVRMLNGDLSNYTLFNREQMEQTRLARVKCNDKLLFDSLLSPNQTLFQLRNLREVQIDSCKIRKVPKGVFSTWTQLRKLHIQTYNYQWSPSVGLEIESGAFQGLSQLETLDLSHSNIWTLDPNVLCPLRNLVKLNMSGNRLIDMDEFGVETNNGKSGVGDAAPSPTGTTGGANKDANYDCVLNVQNLDLSFNSLRRVTASGFSRLRRLVELRLQSNLLQELEDTAFSGLNQLKLLNLSSNRLVALPPSIFTTSSGNLRELYLQNNSISALSPQLFTGFHQLLLLDMSRNSLTSQFVRDTIFSSLIRLIVLKLSFNQLTYVDSTIFKDLVFLQSLHLDNNRIDSISPEAFLSLKNLHILDLSNNRIKFVDNRLLSNLFVLRQLYLDHNIIQEMEDDSLKNCTSLQDFGIADNLLQSVPVALRGLKNLATLDLGENRITAVTNESFAGLSQIIGLRLVDNQLQAIPKGFCDSISRLRVFNVAQNKISKIASQAFISCPEIRVLRLDANRLEEIPLSLKDELPSLLWLNVSMNILKWADYRHLPPTIEWLDLSHNNQLESLVKPENVPISVTSKKNTSPFSLRVLDVSYGQLKFLDHTLIPPTLETLRANYNKGLKTVAPNTFSHSNRLRRVELIGNEISHLPLDSIRFPPIPKGRNLPEMYLGHNPFLCDCSMEWLTRVNQLSNLRQYPRIVDLDAIVCRPAITQSNQLVQLIEMKPKDFVCQYKSHCFQLCMCCEFDACDCSMNCPENCTCFHDSSWSANIVQCSNLAYTKIPPGLPMDATEIYLDGNPMTELGSHIFIGKKNLRSLYLNGSQIETIKNKTFNGLKSLEILHLENNLLEQILGFEFADLESLHELYLQNNLLRFINHNSFSVLKFLQVLRLDGNLLVDFSVWELTRPNGYLNSVMLSGNPWTCNCDFLIPFHRWVASLKSTIVVDFALAKCVPTLEQQQDGSGNNSAMMTAGGSTITTTIASNPTTTHPTILSMCAPLTQISYNRATAGLLPSAASASSGNQAVVNNHISSMGGAVGNIGSSLSGPYHHAHLENHEGNYQQGFPQNENIIATSTAAAGGETGFKAGHDEQFSGNSTFLTCLLTFIAIILVASTAFLLIVFRRRVSTWWCVSKCGINGFSSAMPKCLSTPNPSNEGGVGGNPATASGDMDYYYYSDQEKLFDAYFIYSQKDEEFVTDKLTSELERGVVSSPSSLPQQQQYYPGQSRKLRLCLHYRDLCLASDNPWTSEMIFSACNSSKKVVLVISNNFLNCEWTNNHFKTSVHSAIQQHSRKLIVIKLPPVSDHFTSTICSATPLEWGELNFWPKFRILLPTPAISSTGNNNRNDITCNFPTISSHQTSQLPYTTNLNPNGMNFISNNGSMLPYQIPMIASHHHYHQPSDPVSTTLPPSVVAQQHPFITLMNWTGPQQGIPSLPLGHASSVHPIPSQLTPQHFGYSNVDGFHNVANGQQTILFSQQHQQPLHFSSSNNIRQSLRHQQHHTHNPQHPHHHQPHNHGQHIHSLSQLSNMSSSKSPVEANYSSSAVSSGNEEFDHVYSTLDSPLESPMSDFGPGHVAGQFEVNRHQIQHSTSSGISSGSDTTSGTGGCHPAVGNNPNTNGPPMYFV